MINENVRRVMKMYNPDLRMKDEEEYEETDQEALQRMKKELTNLKQELEDTVDFMKRCLLMETLGHLKTKHGIYEKSDAEWYYEDTEPWAQQYCIFTWDENRNAIPKYWCDSGCKVCDELYRKCQPVVDPADLNRIKVINNIAQKKIEIQQQEDKIKREIAQNQNKQFYNYQLPQTNKTKKK